MTRDIKTIMAETAFYVMCLLIIIAILDVFQIRDLTQTYKDIQAHCPCYEGRDILNVTNYTPGFVFELCNGTINNSYKSWQDMNFSEVYTWK